MRRTVPTLILALLGWALALKPGEVFSLVLPSGSEITAVEQAAELQPPLALSSGDLYLFRVAENASADAGIVVRYRTPSRETGQIRRTVDYRPELRLSFPASLRLGADGRALARIVLENRGNGKADFHIRIRLGTETLYRDTLTLGPGQSGERAIPMDRRGVYLVEVVDTRSGATRYAWLRVSGGGQEGFDEPALDFDLRGGLEAGGPGIELSVSGKLSDYVTARGQARLDPRGPAVSLMLLGPGPRAAWVQQADSGEVVLGYGARPWEGQLAVRYPRVTAAARLSYDPGASRRVGLDLEATPQRLKGRLTASGGPLSSWLEWQSGSGFGGGAEFSWSVAGWVFDTTLGTESDRWRGAFRLFGHGWRAELDLPDPKARLRAEDQGVFGEVELATGSLRFSVGNPNLTLALQAEGGVATPSVSWKGRWALAAVGLSARLSLSPAQGQAELGADAGTFAARVGLALARAPRPDRVWVEGRWRSGAWETRLRLERIANETRVALSGRQRFRLEVPETVADLFGGTRYARVQLDWPCRAERATIEVDGQTRAVAKGQWLRLTPGTHRLALADPLPPGCVAEAWTKTLSLGAGKRARLRLPLVRPARLVITLEGNPPPGSLLVLEGARGAIRRPLSSMVEIDGLPPGTYRLRLLGLGATWEADPQEERLKLRSGEIGSANFTLQRRVLVAESRLRIETLEVSTTTPAPGDSLAVQARVSGADRVYVRIGRRLFPLTRKGEAWFGVAQLPQRLRGRLLLRLVAESQEERRVRNIALSVRPPLR